MRNWGTILLLGTQLYELIQKAEQAFGGGTGTQKRQQVLRDFGTFLETLAKSGTLSAQLSARVLRVAPAVITAVVEVLNVFEAWQAADAASKPPAVSDPAPTPNAPPVVTQTPYLRSLEDSEVPNDSELRNGDEIYSQPWGDGTKRTYIRPFGDRSLLPGGARLIRVVNK